MDSSNRYRLVRLQDQSGLLLNFAQLAEQHLPDAFCHWQTWGKLQRISHDRSSLSPAKAGSLKILNALIIILGCFMTMRKLSAARRHSEIMIAFL
jgi:hypothetical protein